MLISNYPRRQKSTSKELDESTGPWQQELTRTAFNITLFPPLFFYCALFYTDVLSVLSVVVTHLAFDAERPLLVVLCGLVSLNFRQTNIFWVAVYLGGKEILRTLKKQVSDKQRPRCTGFREIVRQSWEEGFVYDPSVREARVEGKRSWDNHFGRILMAFKIIGRVQFRLELSSCRSFRT